MKRNRAFLLGAALSIVLSGHAVADPKPSGLKPMDAQQLANLYAGRTDTWTRNCGGGIYFGGGWEAQATCTKKGDSVGLGKWSVNRKGKVCWELTWYWPDGDGVGSKVEDKNCVTVLLDPQGVVWRNWDGDKDWWKMDVNKDRSFKFKRPITKLRKKLKV